MILMMPSLVSCHSLSTSNTVNCRCVVDPSNLHPPTELNQRALPPCARCGTPKCHRGFAKGFQPCLCWLSWAELRCQEVQANSPVGWWCYPAVILHEWLCLGRWFFKERLDSCKIGKMQYVIFVVRWQRSSERMQSVLGILCWHVHMPCAIRKGDTYCLCTCVFKMYIYIHALPYHAHPLAIFSRGDLGESPEENIQSIFTFHMLGLFIRVNGMKRANIGFILTPLTVNKMVCLYFYHPRGALY